MTAAESVTRVSLGYSVGEVMPTLAELRARKSKALPTHAQTITLDQELIADVQRLEAERADLQVDVRRVGQDGERTGPPPKAGEGSAIPARIEEINAELETLYDRIRESEGELILRGISGGEWQQWKDDHPPRDGNVTDQRIGWGILNATDLLADLGRFVVSWDGEEITEADWPLLADQMPPGDLRDLVVAVVDMHERSGVRIPK